MLRQARQAQGLHIVALAAAIKVTPRKLELLEADRFDELLDATFARALAQAVCRVLKIDAQPVLAKLPAAPGHGLDRVAGGINEPFREHAARQRAGELVAAEEAGGLGAAADRARRSCGVVDAERDLDADSPDGVVRVLSNRPVGDDGCEGALRRRRNRAAGAAAGIGFVRGSGRAAPGAAAETPAPAAGTLTLRTSGRSWVEVLDARGQPLLARLLQPGESVALEGTAPFRVIVGNAAATQMHFRGRPIDLAASTRDNVARLELK